MREDNQSREKFVEELLDAALSNRRVAEAADGIEDRVLANLRRRSRSRRPALRNPAPVMMAAIIVLALVAVDHLIRRRSASDTAMTAVSRVDMPRGAVVSNLTARQAQEGERGSMADGVKLAKAFAGANSAPRRRDLALNLNSRPPDEPSESGLRIEEARISEIRLDDIVIGGNERQE